MILRNIGKRGQAAIEFLMTYGWMLLVVLIVGALIFSFVDFGALLPNKLDLSGNMQGDPGRMVATAGGVNQIQYVVRYIGGPTISVPIDAGNQTLRRNTDSGPDIDNLCQLQSITDADGTEQTTGQINMINGQEAVFTFDCTTGGGNLVNGDVFEGTARISYTDPRTSNLNLRSIGEVRVPISE